MTEDTLLRSTQSVCPECLRTLPAVIVRKSDGNTYIEKDCPEHGHFSCVIWRGGPAIESWGKPVVPDHPKHPFTKVEKGCPHDCGLCPEHNQETCCVLFEVTHRCDLGCPTCFANAGRGTAPADPSLETIRFWYQQLQKAGGRNFIQITGGEPTMRDDLPEIIRMGKEMNFPFFQLNTNGMRIAREEGFIEKLRDAGLDTVFLQFDGTRDDIYRRIRGRDLFEIKKMAIERCRKAGVGVVLVPTIIPGVNDDNLGDIVRFALKNMPVIRSVHIQPVCYMGRYDHTPADSDRITLPEIFRKIEEQTDGAIKAESFKTGGGQHPVCAFQSIFVQMEDGTLEPLTHFVPNNVPVSPKSINKIAVSEICGCGVEITKPQEQSSCCCGNTDNSSAPEICGCGVEIPQTQEQSSCCCGNADNSSPTEVCGCGVEIPAENTVKASDILNKAQHFVSRTWRYPKTNAKVSPGKSINFSSWDNFIERKRTHQFTISGMAFQDAWNLDLERLKLCYIMIMSPEGFIIPFCAYNLTNAIGEPLYRKGHN